jgi:chromosome segregation ATPase
MVQGSGFFRSSSLVLVVGLALGSLVPTHADAAAASAEACNADLHALDSARESLEDLQQAVTQSTADRTALQTSAKALSADIAAATEATQAQRLRARRKATLEEIRSIDAIVPIIHSQAQALAAEIHHVEVAYIACIEATL